MSQSLNEDFRTRCNVNARSQPRAASRLRLASEKLRRILSANDEASISLDCLVGDLDFNGHMTRSEFEALAQPLLDRVALACKEALAASGLEPGTLHSVELVGGFSRTPALENTVSSVLEAPTARTLNSEESVARGAALASAMRSRSVKTRPFHVDEGNLLAGRVRWKHAKSSQLGKQVSSLTLAKGARLPVTQRVTLHPTKKEFLVTYTQDPDKGEPDFVWRVKPRVKTSELVMEVQVDESQIPSLLWYANNGSDSRHLKTQANETSDEQSEANASLPMNPTAFPTEVDTSLDQRFGLSADGMAAAIATEQRLREQDADHEETLAVKNELEATIYKHRSALSERLRDYVADKEHQRLQARLDNLEDWLYADGEHETKERYKEHIDELACALRPIEDRCEAHAMARASLTLLLEECARVTAGIDEPPSAEQVADEDQLLQGACVRAQALIARAKPLRMEGGSENLLSDPVVTSDELQQEISSLRAVEKEVTHRRAAAKEAASAASASPPAHADGGAQPEEDQPKDDHSEADEREPAEESQS